MRDPADTTDLQLAIEGVAARERDDGALDVAINTTRGELTGVLHPREGGTGAALYAAMKFSAELGHNKNIVVFFADAAVGD